MTVWTLKIPGSPPPRPGKAHWAVIQREKRRWTEYLLFLAASKKIPRSVRGEHRHVRIVTYRPGPPSDKDNSYTGVKVCLDAMKNAGLIVDDSPKHITLDVFTVSSRDSRCVITLSDEPIMEL